MTDKTTMYNEDWLKLQRDYWQQLTDMGQKVMGQTAPQLTSQTNPWQSAVDQWWQALSPAASNPAKTFMDRMIDQGKAYFSMSEKLMQAGQGGGSAQEGWSKALSEMQRAFTGGTGSQGDVMQRMLGFWELPLDNWQRMMSSLSPMMPGDMLRNMPHDSMKDGMNRLLSAPGLGYTREEQGQHQEMIRTTMDYQAALQEYIGFFNQLGVKAVTRMQGFLKEQADAGKTIDSARGLYDSWVACCEEVYAEQVRDPEYSRINGQLVNALMRLKQRMSNMVEENLGALNIPTRTEMRTVQDRLQEIRRENRRLRHDLDLIKRQLGGQTTGNPGATATMSSAPKPPAAAPRPPKPVTPRKKPLGKPTGG